MSDFYPRGSRYGWVNADPPCPAPTLAVSGIDPSGAVTLSWSGGATACGYAIFQGSASGQESFLAPVATTDGNTFSAQVTGLTPGDTYYFVMKSLGCNGQGYGCKSNEVVTTVVATVSYAGFVSTLTPNSAQIQAMQQYNRGVFTGSYTLTQTGGGQQYPCFWFPNSFGVPNTFFYSGFPYGMQTSALTVNGVAGTIYLNPSLTHATPMIWSVS